MAVRTEKSGFDYPANSTARIRYFEIVVDYAKVVAARAAAGNTALTAGDGVAVINLGANTLLLGGGVEVTTPSTAATAVLDFGWAAGGNTATLTSDLAANAAGAESNGLAAPVYFTAATTLDLILKTALPTAGVFRVFAIVAECDA